LNVQHLETTLKKLKKAYENINQNGFCILLPDFSSAVTEIITCFAKVTDRVCNFMINETKKDDNSFLK
jgi:hypothetical protein